MHLATVTSAQAGTFTYRYLRGWGSLQHQVEGPAHTVTNEWETDRNVLAQKKNEAGAALISSFQYAVNNLGQRTSVTYGGSAFTRSTAADTPHQATFTYNARGELISRQLTNSDDVNLASETYQFDAIGNRETSSQQTGTATAQTVSYQANPLNQYRSLTDTTTPGGATSTLTHDPDGNALSYILPHNLVGDPPATLRWDAENRLVQIDDAFGNKINYDYDYLSRRTDKRIDDGQVRSTRYFYDGWNPLLIVEPSRTLHLTWGLDLSGTMQGAGGVGGLLAQTEDPDGTNASYYPTYDGNGNVSEYLDGTGTTAGHFEYDGFGKVTHRSGSPSAFPIRFSTKLEDMETGLNSYGYRYYDRNSGRWLSRDPIEEIGGSNIYGFLENDGVDHIDYLGMATIFTPASEEGCQDLLDQVKDLEEEIKERLGKNKELGKQAADDYEDMVGAFMNLGATTIGTALTTKNLRDVQKHLRKNYLGPKGAGWKVNKKGKKPLNKAKASLAAMLAAETAAAFIAKAELNDYLESREALDENNQKILDLQKQRGDLLDQAVSECCGEDELTSTLAD